MKYYSKTYKAIILFIVLHVFFGQIPVKGLTLCIEADGSVNIEILPSGKICAVSQSGEHTDAEYLKENGVGCVEMFDCHSCTDIPILSGAIDTFVPLVKCFSLNNLRLVELPYFFINNFPHFDSVSSLTVIMSPFKLQVLYALHTSVLLI